MKQTVEIILDGVRYTVRGDYCPGCGHSPASFETTRVILPGYQCDARLGMSLATERAIQSEALAACIERDEQIRHDEDPAFAGHHKLGGEEADRT